MTLLDDLPASERAKARRTSMPDWTPPMLATLTERRFSDPGWIFERKFDGIRCLAFGRRGRISLLTRNRLSASDRFSGVVEALAGQGRRAFIADGEVVAFHGRESSFSLLQRRENARIVFQLFDVLHADGWDLTQIAQLHRKALLRGLFDFGGPLRYTTHRTGAGERYAAEAC